MSRRRTFTLSQAPMAVASDGTILANAAYVIGTSRVAEIIATIPEHATVFVGLVVARPSLPDVLGRVEDAAAEIAGTLAPAKFGITPSEASGQAEGPRSSAPSRGPRRRRARGR